METLNLLYPLLTGAVVVPIVSWIKLKLPTDFPIQSTVLAGLLNIIIIYALAQLFAPDMTWEQIIQFSLGAQVTSQFVHAGVKSNNKLKAKV